MMSGRNNARQAIDTTKNTMICTVRSAPRKPATNAARPPTTNQMVIRPIEAISTTAMTAAIANHQYGLMRTPFFDFEYSSPSRIGGDFRHIAWRLEQRELVGLRGRFEVLGRRVPLEGGAVGERGPFGGKPRAHFLEAQ